MDEETVSEESGINWDEFKEQLKGVWDELKDRDLDGARDSLDNVVDFIQQATGEATEKVRKKVEKLADRVDFELGS